MTKTAQSYGATPHEWGTFDVLMGLTADLLPVVANPKAIISPDSKMKDKGKVPSHYNRQGHVVGMADWTRRIATDLDIERWSVRKDYGICIQTRNVRALDIDVPDATKAALIGLIIEQELGAMPVRFRNNSWKFLVAFRLEGQFTKRIIRVTEKTEKEPSQLIEFLATGQQFIAAGTHSTGARIEWKWNGHEDFPVVQAADFERLWARLEREFGIAPTMRMTLRERGESFESPDAVAEMLVEKGLALGEGNDGQLFIECPWKDNHSSDSGMTETAYFPRGTNGYDLGHFKCLHAGCADKTDTDFEEKLGLRDDMFEVVEVTPETNEKGEVVQGPPPYERDKKGVIKARLFNLALALARPDVIGREIRFDVYRDEDMVRLPGGDWRPLTDGDLVKLRTHLERVVRFESIGRELMRDALAAHGEDYRFDSAIETLERLPDWDGKPRIDTFMHRYFGAEDTAYSRAVGRYLWSALAGRTLQPGVKADMAVILRGEQGVIKSSAIAALALDEDQFGEISLGEPEDKLARLMRGKSVMELGELRGFYSKEFEAIKAWIVRRFDEWVPKYKEKRIKFYRRCVFIGTTNHVEFLVDETGNRRFLPVEVKRADIKAIRRDRYQLWAEARDLFVAEGICWQEAEELAKGEHAKFTMHDSWEDDVSTWLDLEDVDGSKPRDRDFLRTSDVMREALNIDARSANAGIERRVAKVLISLGYSRARQYVDGKQVRVFVKG